MKLAIGMVRLLISFLLILTTFVTSAQSSAVVTPTTNSLLTTGRWFMIKVDTSGVYRITYEELLKIGLDNPAQTRIFSYGGRILPMYCGVPVPDDLNEIRREAANEITAGSAVGNEIRVCDANKREQRIQTTT